MDLEHCLNNSCVSPVQILRKVQVNPVHYLNNSRTLPVQLSCKVLANLMHYQIILVQVLLTAPGKALASLVRGLYKVLAQPLNESGAVPE